MFIYQKKPSCIQIIQLCRYFVKEKDIKSVISGISMPSSNYNFMQYGMKVLKLPDIYNWSEEKEVCYLV